MTATDLLKVESNAPVLSFNFEGLKAWATELTDRYKGLVVTEEGLADVKRDMAEINRHKNALEEARKETVRRVSEPIRAFETQVKEVCAIFDATYAALGGQVKAFEDAEREKKRKDVEGLIIEANLNAFDNTGFLDIPIQEKWLNKTTTWKAIREDIAAIIARHLEEEERRKALERARQDRAAAIERRVQDLNAQHDINVSVSGFMSGGLDLNRPIAEVFTEIDEFYARMLRSREENASKPKTYPEAVSPLRAVGGKAQTQAQTRAMTIILEYDLACESHVKACLETLKPLCVSYGARYR